MPQAPPLDHRLMRPVITSYSIHYTKLYDSLDVSNGGVLLALPALLNLGLLNHLEYLALPDGYYRLDSIV